MSYIWAEWHSRGGQQVSPTFDTPKQAGEWRRDHPPIREHATPTLWWKDPDGTRQRCSITELVAAYTEFGWTDQRPVSDRLDFSSEATKLP